MGWAQTVWMHPNRGQWDERINYQVELENGNLYIEDQGITIFMSDFNEHSHPHEGAEAENETYRYHSIRTYFPESKKGATFEQEKSTFYRNYLLGDDADLWKSEIYSTSDLLIKEFFEGIDLNYNGEEGGLKYSFIVQPGADVLQIRSVYSGQSDLSIDGVGNLHVSHRFGEIIEQKPVAWTEGSKGRQKVEVHFKLSGDTLTYEFPRGYDKSQTLVIDPNLTFSTFSGSSADNWGFTACPDANGNLFGGGIVNNIGYPVTVGAFDTTFNSGSWDTAITKFTADGSTLIYSTYLGGSGSETPNSIVCSPTGELFVFGVTSSSNFPIAGVPYDNSYNGGPSIPDNQTNNLGFTNGSDLYVARLNAAGTNLLASTFVGGTGNDGINVSTLKFNYGDQFRGEIILDALGNVYVASITQSTNFPVVLGTQGSLNGSQDAVLFKMPSTLSALTWSTYFGGSGIETGNSVQVASSGRVYMAGGTTSPSLPIVSGADLTFDGVSDGYVARFDGNTGSSLSGTYIGANEYDQAYFVQLDIDDYVYILGQSETNLGVSTTFGVANSGQFIWKFDQNLSTVQWRTMIGAGTGHVEISPTAFLVSDCYDIYLSGWGGQLNANANVSQAVNSTTVGFPVTVDAYQPNTNGSNFYIAVLDQDAAFLKYGTYFGGVNSSYNHVDGGTSRFDKSGRIYHAVCGACGGNPNGFSTTAGTWSPTNQSSNCNMATFKFELSTIEAVVSNPDPIVCLPDPVIFNNNSSNGNAFFWNFGDNTTSTAVNPVHLYPGPGDYTVTLVVSDTNGCFSPDSIEFQITIGDFNGGVVIPPGPICPGESFQLEAYGGVDYEWSPVQFLDNPTSATPIATIDQSTWFTVIISDSCGVDTVSVELEVFSGTAAISNDTSICIGNSVDLFATGGSTYLWSPPQFLNNPSSSTPVSTPTSDITYNVLITTSDGCELEESVSIDVYFDPPFPVMEDTIRLCEGSSRSIVVSGGDTYLWYPDQFINTTSGSTVVVNPIADMMYYCDFTNACGTVSDSVWIDVITAVIHAGNDTIICPGETATLWAQGGVSYYWYPSGTLSSWQTSLVLATPIEATMYYVTGTDIYGCSATDSVFVDLYPQAFIQTNPDVYAFYGDEVPLSATSSTVGSYVWSPVEYLSCVVCPSPVAIPNMNYTYFVSYTDANGCSASDSVNIIYDPIIYVPNTFTPNDDETNQVFRAFGGNILSFEMLIFNRWGELICTLTELEEFWDGTYEGLLCQDGTYTWKIRITDLEGFEHAYVGHVNLVR